MSRSLFIALMIALVQPCNATNVPSDADILAVRDFIKSDKSYSHQARAEAERRALKLDEYLADKARFEIEVAQIVALADNGHTAMFPAQWTRRYPRSPIRLGLFADGLYVISAPPSAKALLGRPIEKINGVPWRHIRARYSTLQGGTEHFKDQFFPIFAETPALLHATGFGSDPDRLDLAFQGGGSIAVLPIMTPLADALSDEPISRAGVDLVEGELPLYLRNPDQPLFSTFLSDLNATYIRIDRTYGDDIAPFLAKSLADLRRNPNRNIILDLRFNLGGDLNNTRDFVKQITRIAKDTKVYVITSGRTFSAAISTLGYVKQAGKRNVHIVGEPVGDRLEFWAEGRMTVLPGLGALLLNATERHNYRTGCPEPDCHLSIRQHPIRVESLDPSIPAPLTFADFRAGRDPSIEAIREHIRSNKVWAKM